MTDSTITELRRAVRGLKNPPAAELIRAVENVAQKMKFWQQTAQKLLEGA